MSDYLGFIAGHEGLTVYRGCTSYQSHSPSLISEKYWRKGNHDNKINLYCHGYLQHAHTLINLSPLNLERQAYLDIGEN